MENILLISDVMIKERTAIHGNIDPKLIYPDIKVAQDMFIMPVTGSTLFYKLQDLINTDTLTDNVNAKYKLLIDKFIADALIYHTLSELPTTLSYQFWNKGVVRKQGESTELPSMGELIDLSNKYRNRAEFYDNRLRLYLQQNMVDYPEYMKVANGIDTVLPDDKSFTNPIYLGDEDECSTCGTIYTTYQQQATDKTLNLNWTAAGTEGSVINVSAVNGLTALLNTNILLIAREDKVIYENKAATGSLLTTEYRWLNKIILQLGSPTIAGERFLFIYKK